MDEDSRAHLADRYGHAAQLVLRLAAVDPTLARRISPGLPDIAAEAAYAAGHEQAHTVGDVLLRRTRLGLLDARRLCEPDAGGPLAVAQAMAGELGWDDARIEREVERVARAGAGGGSRSRAGRRRRCREREPEEPSAAAPGAAPEEAA